MQTISWLIQFCHFTGNSATTLLSSSTHLSSMPLLLQKWCTYSIQVSYYQVIFTQEVKRKKKLKTWPSRLNYLICLHKRAIYSTLLSIPECCKLFKIEITCGDKLALYICMGVHWQITANRKEYDNGWNDKASQVKIHSQGLFPDKWYRSSHFAIRRN